MDDCDIMELRFYDILNTNPCDPITYFMSYIDGMKTSDIANEVDIMKSSLSPQQVSIKDIGMDEFIKDYMHLVNEYQLYTNMVSEDRPEDILRNVSRDAYNTVKPFGPEHIRMVIDEYPERVRKDYLCFQVVENDAYGMYRMHMLMHDESDLIINTLDFGYYNAKEIADKYF